MRTNPNFIVAFLISLSITATLSIIAFVDFTLILVLKYMGLLFVLLSTIFGFRFVLNYEFRKSVEKPVKVKPRADLQLPDMKVIEPKPKDIVTAANRVLSENGRYGFSIYEKPVLDSIKYQVFQKTGISTENEKVIQVLSSSPLYGKEKNFIYNKAGRIEEMKQEQALNEQNNQNKNWLGTLPDRVGE